MSVLAIKGGTPVRTRMFPAYRIFGEEEKTAACRVIDSNVLSKFLGTWHPDFYGGPEVRGFEGAWKELYGVKHAVALNSATSGLYACVGAAGIGPGDEVIVSPYTMSASCVAALVYGAIPVFADIEPDYFCLDPKSIEARITPRTRAIIVVDIFGQPYDVEAINRIAEKHGLVVIEDCAQAPLATWRGRYAGTFGTMGVYSLNYHKHVHTGEGGVVVTEDDDLAERVRLIRNHAEAVVEAKGVTDIVNMIGFNYRMTELEAAIGQEQVKKVRGLIDARRRNADLLAAGIGQIDGITPPATRADCTNSYYFMAFKYDKTKLKDVPRDTFIKAVKAELPDTELREGEGAQIGMGYVKPLYLQPLYQQKIAFGRNGWPFSAAPELPSYERGICPVVEKLHFEELFTTELMRPPMTSEDLQAVIDAFHKVYAHLDELRPSGAAVAVL